MVLGFYPDHSYLAEISGDGVAMTVRFTGYFVHVEGQEVPEMFSLVPVDTISDQRSAQGIAA